MLDSAIFRNKMPDFDKLIEFGFVFAKEHYIYSCEIVNNQFRLIVSISQKGDVNTKVLDVDGDEEYVLHLVADAAGSFVGKVRAEYLQVLQLISDECFMPRVFKSEYAEEIISYLKTKYQNELEFLWNTFPQNAVVRRQDNKKWYAVFLTVAKNKLGLGDIESIEIIDVRVKKEEIGSIVDNKKYFPGYHMNKQHWVTICLDGSVSLGEIIERIDDSYILAKK